LTEEEEKKIRKIEKEFKVRLIRLTYHLDSYGKKVPCYHFKAKKGNPLKKIFESIMKKEKRS